MTGQSLIAMLMPFLASAAFVTLNEMGDKTQLLAMAMATRIRFWKVMTGVLIATLLNHGLAVAAGTLLASVPGWQGWVKLAASVLFIVFGLWALKSDKIGDSQPQRRGCGDVATVAIAFFVAEMGDKTQLATITLSAKYSYAPLLVLAGTTTGMLIADGLGIFVGVILHRKLPDAALKIAASATFVLFGIAGLRDALMAAIHLSAGNAAAVTALTAALSVILGFRIYRKEKKSTTV